MAFLMRNLELVARKIIKIFFFQKKNKNTSFSLGVQGYYFLRAL